MADDSTDNISDMEMTVTAAGQKNTNTNARIFHMSDSSEEEEKSAPSERSFPSVDSDISSIDIRHVSSVSKGTPRASAEVAPAPVSGAPAVFHLSDSDSDTDTESVPSVSGNGVRGAEPTVAAGFDLSDSSDD